MKMESDELLLEKKNGVRIIRFNRPDKKNAMTPTLYKAVTKILNEDANDNEIVVTILTGVGEYYSSGNDIVASFTGEIVREDRVLDIKNIVQAFINYPKLLIAVVNGPAIGIGATSAGLCDIVYASENAYFEAPFLKMGLCCESCSSYTFPAALGRSKASEVLFLNHKLTAQEAYKFGLVAKVVTKDKIDELIEDLRKYGNLPLDSVKINKHLVMKHLQKTLHECNEYEMIQGNICLESEEFSNAIYSFLSNRSKL